MDGETLLWMNMILAVSQNTNKHWCLPQQHQGNTAASSASTTHNSYSSFGVTFTWSGKCKPMTGTSRCPDNTYVTSAERKSLFTHPDQKTKNWNMKCTEMSEFTTSLQNWHFLLARNESLSLSYKDIAHWNICNTHTQRATAVSHILMQKDGV